MNQSIVPSFKSRCAGRRAFYIVLAVFFIALESSAATPYTVEGVKVDVTAESALAARDQAFGKAQTDAFTLLAKNLLPPARFSGFTAPAPAVLAGMIRDYEITEEKISKTRYSGTYTFRFKEGPVHRYFGLNPGSDFSAQGLSGYGQQPSGGGAYRQASLLVLPFYREGDVIALWSPENVWLRAWNDSIQGGSTLLTVPIGDLLDVKDISDGEALTYNRTRLQNMTSRYGAEEAVLAVAIADMPQPGALTVNIYRTDRGGPELAQKIFVSNMGQSQNALMNEAVSRTREALRGSWKDRSEPQTAAHSDEMAPMSQLNGQGGHYLGSVRFANLQEWAAMQRSISTIPGVSRVVIQSMSPREAILEISYAGDARILQNALTPYRVSLVGPGMAPAPSYARPVAPPPQLQPPQYQNDFYEPSESSNSIAGSETTYNPIPERAPSRRPSSYINNF